jgi:hypothetical protein
MDVRRYRVNTGQGYKGFRVDVDMVKTYAVRDGSRIAHIFHGGDTACHLWTTGGITRKNSYKFVDKKPKSKRLCQMCAVNFQKIKHRIEEDTGKEFWQKIDGGGYACEEVVWED